MQMSIDRISFLLEAAEILQAGGRAGSAKLLLSYLSGQKYNLPILRRLRALWWEVGRDPNVKLGKFAADNWAKHGIDTRPRLKCLTVLDAMSEHNWSTDLDCTRLTRSLALQQIVEADYDFVLMETAWLGPENDWLYAFTAPDQKHENAQILLTVLEQLRTAIDKPIVMINKEDPLHFERFFPLVRHADHIFTTDQDMVPEYGDRTDALSTTALPFAANMALTNPVGRVNEPQGGVCFAGSFYSGGYEERARQMDYVLQPILDFDGVIYDRQSANPDPMHDFPERFRPYIRPAVAFREMTGLYRRFRVFLNVNTIISSPTMMSRRVYELLASGTPVVSAPSRALEEQFPGIVHTASDAQEARSQVARLLEDERHWWKTSQRGIREVALRHQYRHRAELIRSIVFGAPNEASNPLVSIVVAAGSQMHLDRIVDNVSKQTYPRMEAVVTLDESWPEEKIASLENRLTGTPRVERISILKFPDSALPGQRLNAAVDEAKGDFIAKFSAEDRYLPNYLLDMILTFDFSGADLAGKATYTAWKEAEDRLVLCNPTREHSHVERICESTIVARRSWLMKIPFADRNHTIETDILKRTLSASGRIYSADHFNFIRVHGSDNAPDSWKMKKELLDMTTITVGTSREFGQWEA